MIINIVYIIFIQHLKRVDEERLTVFSMITLLQIYC